ncbi:MAG: hypothetical protein FWC50_08715, partial [Planctomycetaceae bacterium]|nr:hypothetical protein [Planctomycetaceae bacterium]
MKTTTFSIILTILGLTCLSMFAGCSGYSKSLSLDSLQSTGQPSKVIAFWDTVIRQEDGKATRGFAARVMFYDSSHKKALRTKGEFDVYAFDEDGRKPDNAVPTKIIKFHAEDLKLLESKSKMLGTSYTIWVPWDEAKPDSPEKTISLIVRFRCSDGEMLMSQQATMTLPGEQTKNKEEIAQAKYSNPFTDNMIRQTSFLNEAAGQRKSNPELSDTNWNGRVDERMISHEMRPQGITTTTITVPVVPQNGAPPKVTTTKSVLEQIPEERRYQAEMMIRQTRKQNANPGGNGKDAGWAGQVTPATLQPASQQNTAFNNTAL